MDEIIGLRGRFVKMEADGTSGSHSLPGSALPAFSVVDGEGKKVLRGAAARPCLRGEGLPPATDTVSVPAILQNPAGNEKATESWPDRIIKKGQVKHGGNAECSNAIPPLSHERSPKAAPAKGSIRSPDFPFRDSGKQG